ncbi:hypothetical protein [Caballeronia terrestris]|uniref:hypothetical protein n=1 Tax=Caballeronia terrestris TaxID=1226301 RepID=UPI000F739D62|nr:hypothetical protein [Caballeronia terrestris]
MGRIWSGWIERCLFRTVRVSTLDIARAGLAIDSDNALLHHNACCACNMRGDLGAMRVQHRRRAPVARNAGMQFNLAVTHLRFAEFERGWQR